MSPKERVPASGRRQVVYLLGAAGAARLLGRLPLAGAEPLAAAAPAAGAVCVVRPAQPEGPFFIDERLERSDIRVDTRDGSVRAGLALDITFRVTRGGRERCTPLDKAVVDVWNSDAQGRYSDTGDARGATFLRGYQVTRAGGQARFTTIYPGWYGGRTVHVHFKIRSGPQAAVPFEFTSELYFEEATSDAVFAQAPYAGRGVRSTHNGDDWMFQHGGRDLVLPVTRSGDGLAGTLDITLQI
jgi:protocatechuate 3,4-dioxygenase beta subunit